MDKFRSLKVDKFKSFKKKSLNHLFITKEYFVYHICIIDASPPPLVYLSETKRTNVLANDKSSNTTFSHILPQTNENRLKMEQKLHFLHI